MSLITFSRAPGTKVDIDIQPSNLAPAQNTVVIVGHMAAAVQTIAFSAVAASGTFVLNFGGHATAAINFGDSAMVIQGKIQAVTGLSAATVTGSIASKSLVITNPVSMPLATVSGNSLEDSDSASVSVTPTVTAAGGSATANAPYEMENFGDSASALTECNTQFGSGSEVGEMVVAAIKAIEGTDMVPQVFPPLVVIPMGNGDDDLAGALAANVTLSAPFIVSPYSSSDSDHMADFKEFLTTISGDDRGRYAQFGSFGFMATDEDLSPATTEGEAAASETLVIAWLRDLSVSKTNDPIQCAAALAAICAANGFPFIPVNDIVLGGILPPTSAADQQTPGDDGTEASGLEAGLVPLMSGQDGLVRVSRSVTTYRPDEASAATSYIDLQDWQSLYYLRQQIYLLCQQTRYLRAKNSATKQASLKSEVIAILLELEKPDPDGNAMLQNVEALVSQIVVTDAPDGNVYATQIDIPADVIPGFHNKGIFIHGVTS